MSTNDDTLFQSIASIIDKDIRPYIEADGGQIKLKTVEEGIVFVQLSGACAGCPGAAMTLKGGVERILKMKNSNVKEVRLAY
jgi:NFU1 iron-sulfur cluster scaffold homolog, mitochondrial